MFILSTDTVSAALGNNALFLFPKEEGILYAKTESTLTRSGTSFESAIIRMMTPVPLTDSFLIIPMIGYRNYDIFFNSHDPVNGRYNSFHSLMASAGFIKCIGDNLAVYSAYRRNINRDPVDLNSGDNKDSIDLLAVYSTDGKFSLQLGFTKNIYDNRSYPIPLAGLTYYPGNHTVDVEIFLPQKAFVYYYFTSEFSLLLKTELKYESWTAEADNPGKKHEVKLTAVRAAAGPRYRLYKGIYFISELGFSPYLHIENGNAGTAAVNDVFINFIFNISTELFRK